MNGYNQYFASPLSSSYAGSDPGFVQRSLWRVSYAGCAMANATNFTTVPGGRRRSSENIVQGPVDDQIYFVPDGWTVEKGTQSTCDTEFSVTVSQSSYDYSLNNADSTSISAGAFGVSVSYSDDSTSFQQQNEQSSLILTQAGAECVNYVMTLDTSNPPKTSNTFLYTISNLDTENDTWYKFFDMYGTQYPTQIMFGARYGYSCYLSEDSYTSYSNSSDTTTVKGSASTTPAPTEKSASTDIIKTQVTEKVRNTFSVAVTGSDASSTSENDSSSDYFSETKEFSLGSKMPRSVNGTPDIQSWAEKVNAEPMPTRYDLVSICQHPALTSLKATCDQFATSYCTNYLNKDSPEKCDVPSQPECVWDIQCPAYNDCIDGTCVEQPWCTFSIYDNNDNKLVYGPVYYVNNETGFTFWYSKDWGNAIEHGKYSGGCAKVELFDDDYWLSTDNHCQQGNKDNLKLSNYDYDDEQSFDLQTKIDDGDYYDLNHDTCGVHLTPKQDWVNRRRDPDAAPPTPAPTPAPTTGILCSCTASSSRNYTCTDGTSGRCGNGFVCASVVPFSLAT
jgi:hypothetical protein